MLTSFDEHRAMLSAIVNGDMAGASAACRHHLAQFCRR
jgi:DNA-binding GntR family transcriptional regulator